jgi:hypothetical protein
MPFRTNALPPLKDQLSPVKIKSPIEQHMIGRGGLFRQENIEKRRILSVREWAELCSRDEFKAPGINDLGLHARNAVSQVKPAKKRKKVGAIKADIVEGQYDGKQDSVNEDTTTPGTPNDTVDFEAAEIEPDAFQPKSDDIGKMKTKSPTQTRAAKEANLAARAALDAAFLETFEPHSHWLPENTTPSNYTPEFCQRLERQYWRNCGLGRPAWYGADSQGLFTSLTLDYV